MPYDLRDIRREVEALEGRYPAYVKSPDRLFVLWFLTATIADSDVRAENALTGIGNDGGVDAIYVDGGNRAVYLIQGKYHRSDDVSGKRSDVKALADLGRALLEDDERPFESTVKGIDAAVREKLRDARRRIHQEGYELYVVFLITGRVTPSLLDEARGRMHRWRSRSDFDVFGSDRLVKLVRDYQEGAAPPVPLIRLKIRGDETFKKIDKATGLTYFLATIETRSLAEIGERYKDRIFARNVRGFRGDTKINRAIAATLKTRPEYFWYYNNGVTIVCDEADRAEEGPASYLNIRNAQIINGQQTTRVLAQNAKVSGAAVLAKVIAVPYSGPRDKQRYRELVQTVVKATNWQNPISQADIQSTDDEQIRIDDEMRRTNKYVYIRKRAARSELRRLIGGRAAFKVSKEDLARALAACHLDPANVQKGTDYLFGEPYRSLFPSQGRSLREYISVFWLSEAVRLAAKSDRRRRSYARWVVLRELFKELEADLAVPARGRALIEMCERDRLFRRQMNSLTIVANALFVDALGLYRSANRAEEGLEQAVYFKRTGVFAALGKRTKRPTSDRSRPYVQKHMAKLRLLIRQMAKAA